MKIAAHPLIVAAALGLVGPSALEQDDLEPSEPGNVDLVERAPTNAQMAELEARWVAARARVGE